MNNNETELKYQFLFKTWLGGACFGRKIPVGTPTQLLLEWDAAAVTMETEASIDFEGPFCSLPSSLHPHPLTLPDVVP
ncbi:hypothetical protein CDAR_303311 [Caerostris darwini]|uniref:Uncharacterized protein n=1 Tax=Caerostris darwini TaxID=1538125 RepID=A0AAV4S4L3_9ARAC|nr:hypothetical protein CDAR_303311 [Caerostris darwini]